MNKSETNLQENLSLEIYPPISSVKEKTSKSNKPTINHKLKTLSLFSGAGGLDIGFHNAGFDIKQCVEIDKRFCETLKYNKKYFNNSEILNEDISKLELSNLKKGYKVIIGGPPCQSFSQSGFRRGLQDPRGLLFQQFVNILKYTKSDVFLFENVRGLLYANGGEALKEITNQFRDIGYDLEVRLLNAADYGVPQFRERIFILGSKIGKLKFPYPTHGPDSLDNRPFTSVLDSIKDIFNKNEKKQIMTGKYGHLLSEVPEGHNYSFFTEKMGYPNPVFGWRTKFSNFLYKLDRHQPSRTIQAQPGKYSGPFHWNNRKLTTEELLRIQSFPKDFTFIGGTSVALHQIGNSVAPLLSYKIATSIKKQILNEKINSNELIESDFKFSFDKRKGDLAQKTRRTGIKNLSKNEVLPLFEKID